MTVDALSALVMRSNPAAAGVAVAILWWALTATTSGQHDRRCEYHYHRHIKLVHRISFVRAAFERAEAIALVPKGQQRTARFAKSINTFCDEHASS